MQRCDIAGGILSAVFQQVVAAHAERLGQLGDLIIRHEPNALFNAQNGYFVHFHSGKLHARGQLTLQAVLPFSGPNVDADGAESDQLATIIVQNDGGMAVGAADITLTCEDGAELRFRVTDLPVGGSCYAFELNSAQYTGENRVCAASAEVEPDGSLSVDYRVSVMVQDGGLVLVNMTEDTLHNVTVRYRTDTGGTYFGGLSYTATVEELAPGASQTVLAAECYMGLPSVIAVSADES